MRKAAMIVGDFLKKNIVFCIAVTAAIVTMFFVPIDSQYIQYFDFKILACIFCVLAVVNGLHHIHFFEIISKKIIQRFRTVKMAVLALIYLTFVASMIIANDLALITFLPLGYYLLKNSDNLKWMAFTFIMQTIAANLGGMLTPFGNPQNLYLYNLSEMNAGEFLVLMLPYTVVSGVLLALTIFVLSARKRKIRLTDCHFSEEKKEMNKKLTGMYAVLFLMALLVVARILPYYILLAAVAVSVFLSDRKVLGQVDYCLIFTFIAFFIFTGNIGRLPAFQEVLHSLVNGRELLVGIATSQVISNVPAALLLSGFSGDLKQLLLGVNLGGLGTLIASMASLISYKIYAHNYNRTKGYYLLWFHLANIIFLAVLVLLALGMR